MHATTRQQIRRFLISLGIIYALTGQPICPRGLANVQILKSFGGTTFVDGQNPVGQLIETGNGALFGVTAQGGKKGGGTIFKLNLDGTGYSVLHEFGVSNSDGSFPGSLVRGKDGAFYGTTSKGGTNGYGIVFKFSPAENAFAVLYNFIPYGENPSGFDPYTSSSLIQGNDGTLYGTAANGYYPTTNVVFRLGPDGQGFQVLHIIEPPLGEQIDPPLVQGSDGALYGVARNGGTNTLGTVFKLNTDGSGYRVLYNFVGGTGDGAHPEAALIQASDGTLYGTTGSGGNFGLGTIFKIDTNGAAYQMVYSLNVATIYGAGAQQSVIQATDGNLYSVNFGGGDATGAAFEFNPGDGSFELLHVFGTFPGDGVGPAGPMVQASNGALYGTTYHGGALGLGAVFTMRLDGTGYQLLYSFGATIKDSAGPAASLVRSLDGAIAGTTTAGGIKGQGTVFTMAPDGNAFSVLHSFGGQPQDGSDPQSSLAEGTDGAFYGTTFTGGTNNAGTIFQISADGLIYGLLHEFGLTPGDGVNPRAPLIQGTNGSLYGTTLSGGISNLGTVFRVNPDGTAYQVLHSFGVDSNDGAGPWAGLLLGMDGALYGTTYSGGTNRTGTVFRLNQDGSNYGLLRGFPGGFPAANLVQGGDGSLYGTDLFGGRNGQGAVFKLSPDGSNFQLLHSFGSDASDGRVPQAALVFASDGGIYGTTTSGGEKSGGTVYRLNPDGSDYSVIHSFGSNAGDGLTPQAALLQGPGGVSFGTTVRGGGNGAGTIFLLTAPPLLPNPPFGISIALLNGGGAEISFGGTTGITYQFQTSTNLLDWITLGSVFNESGLVQFLDWNGSKNPQQYYRAVYSQ